MPPGSSEKLDSLANTEYHPRPPPSTIHVFWSAFAKSLKTFAGMRLSAHSWKRGSSDS
jgi:hypothetical protein